MLTTLATENDRVRRHTASHVNAKIDAATYSNIEYFAREPRAELDRRITKLQHEWDIERILETNASTLALSSLIFGITVNRRWLLLSGAVLGFLLLHATQGWCPPIPALRRLGVRTRSEIDRELLALQYLRGDFDDHLPPLRTRRRLSALVADT